MPRSGPPVLVTGIPRSGTTWVARTLATRAGRTSMLGREPMNPRAGQFALGGTCRTWVRLTGPAAQERSVLRRAYAGLAPRAYGRLGVRQWAAALPGTRVVVKDPFALLSVPTVVAATGAVPVVVYRDPVSVLASYRRMGWRADTAEFVALGGDAPEGDDDLSAMTAFWSWGYRTVLADTADLPGTVVVSHAELTGGGARAEAALLRALGLPVQDRDRPARAERGAAARTAAPATATPALHVFDRTPDEVLSGWRTRVSDPEVALVRAQTREVWAALEARRLPLGT